jgi:hypothetical protein
MFAGKDPTERHGTMWNKAVQLAWNGAVGLIFLGVIGFTMTAKAMIEKR